MTFSTNSANIFSSNVTLYGEQVDELNFLKNIEDLDEKLTLIPCAHKVQSTILKGKKTCPQCRGTIKGYFSSAQVKKVCDNLSKLSEGFKAEHKLVRKKLSSDNLPEKD